jgi:hypothetical protein
MLFCNLLLSVEVGKRERVEGTGEKKRKRKHNTRGEL